MYLIVKAFIPATITVEGVEYLKESWDKKRIQEAIENFFGKKINVKSYFYLQYKKETQYAKVINVHEWHNTPIINRKSGTTILSENKKQEKVEQELWIRETGIITYQLVLKKEITLPNNTHEFTKSINHLIKNLKRTIEKTYNNVLINGLIPVLKKEINKTEKSRKKLSHLPKDDKNKINKSLNLEKGKIVVFTFIHLKSDNEFTFLHKWLKTDLRILGGSNSPIIHVRNNDLRYHSRGFHVLISKDPLLSRKSRKILQLEITNALHIAYTTPLVLKNTLMTLNYQNSEIKTSTWQYIIHYLNPFVLEGKTNFDSLFVKSVVRSWFIRVDLLLKLREKFINFFESITNSKEFLLYAPIIIHELVKLPTGKNVTLNPFINKIGSPNLLLKKDLKIRIIDILVKHEKNLLSGDTDLKYERGLTASKITQMLYIPNGMQTSKIRSYLDDLVKAGFVEWSPYLGPGRRKNSRMFFLSENFSSVREIYNLVIKEKLIDLLNTINNTSSISKNNNLI